MVTDAFLVVALSRKYGKRLACYTLAMLCLTSGCFFASTSMLLLIICLGCSFVTFRIFCSTTCLCHPIYSRQALIIRENDVIKLYVEN